LLPVKHTEEHDGDCVVQDRLPKHQGIEQRVAVKLGVAHDRQGCHLVEQKKKKKKIKEHQNL